MSHPAISARQIFIRARLEELRQKIELLMDNEELNTVYIHRLEHKIDNYEAELEALALEASDPAAHGYQ